MENDSGKIIFTLSGLNETRTNKQVFFAFSLLIYICTLLVDLTLIMTIFLERNLHTPMYVFLCSLCLNAMYGATGFYPKLLHDLLSDSQVISYAACVTQMFVVYNYVFCEFFNLTMMTYDRYNAICRPLEYHTIMTPRKVRKLLLTAWIFPFSEAAIGILLTIRLPLCGSAIDKLYCTNWEVVKLACVDTTLNNLYGYVLIFLHISQFIMITVSYIHIIRTCLRSRAEQKKFMETCLPHLIALINFTVSVAFDALYSRYGSKSTLLALRSILTIEYLMVPPLLNPLIYGLKLKQVRRGLCRRFGIKVRSLK